MDTNQEARQFLYTQRDFERVRRLIYTRAGISLGPSKGNMVYSRLSRRLRALGLDSVRGYLDRLEDDAASGEWQAFTNALTTNLTSFFREGHHFDVLRAHLASRASAEPARIWCASGGRCSWEPKRRLSLHSRISWGSTNPARRASRCGARWMAQRSSGRPRSRRAAWLLRSPKCRPG